MKGSTNGRGDPAEIPAADLYPEQVLPRVPPVTRGSYACTPRGLTGTDEWADLSLQARLVGLTLFTLMPAAPVAPMPTAVLAGFTGLPRAQCAGALAELGGAGYLVRLGDGQWAAPVLLDAVKGRGRYRVLRDVRDLSDDAKAVLAERHPWVLLRAKDLPVDVVENSRATRARAPGPVTEPNRTKGPKPFGSGSTCKAPKEAVVPDRPGGATVAPSRDVKGNGAAAPADAGDTGPPSAVADPPEAAPTALPAVDFRAMLAAHGVTGPDGLPSPTIEDPKDAAAFEAAREAAKAQAVSVLGHTTPTRRVI